MDRYMSKLEELEELKCKLSFPSQRNQSSDRYSTSAKPLSDARSNRNSETQPHSVEKFLNLRQQNQNVNNLVCSWYEQKNQSISLNQDPIQESPEFDSPQTKGGTLTHLIIDEVPHVEEIEKPVTSSTKQINKYPATTKSNLQPRKSQGLVSQISKMNASRPQTTKQQQNKKAVPTMKQSQEFNDNTKTGMKQSQLLEKARQVKTTQQVKQVKKTNDEEKALIQQITTLKASVLKIYHDKHINHQVIEKNFDQIINSMKLDFRCPEL